MRHGLGRCRSAFDQRDRTECGAGFARQTGPRAKRCPEPEQIGCAPQRAKCRIVDGGKTSEDARDLEGAADAEPGALLDRQRGDVDAVEYDSAGIRDKLAADPMGRFWYGSVRYAFK